MENQKWIIKIINACYSKIKIIYRDVQVLPCQILRLEEYKNNIRGTI